MKICIISFILLFHSAFAQENSTNLSLTGNLSSDSKIILKNYNYELASHYNFQSEKRKSPLLGGLMSLIIPGAGEIYAEEYWKAGVFVAVEAIAITVAVIYDKKGDNKTAEFENFANQNWSSERYAQWTLDNLQYLNASLDRNNYTVFVDGMVNWQELNRLERDIGNGYSHSLAPFGDQQYYEMIGKYPQFSHGWSDSNPNETDYHILSPYFKSYSIMRGDANDLYNVASTAVIAIYVNHFLSALDAAWSTANYNKDLTLRMRVEQQNLAGKTELVPTLKLSMSF